LKAAAKLLSLFFCLSIILLAHRSGASTQDKASSSVKQEASKEKWEYYASDEDGTDYSYDPHTLKHMKGNRIEVWVRAVYSEQNPKYSQAELQWEIDCSKKSMRGLTVNAKKKDGTQENIKKSSDWSAIPSESTAETLYEKVCRKKDKKTP
jgi:surface-adhesin protein E